MNDSGTGIDRGPGTGSLQDRSGDMTSENTVRYGEYETSSILIVGEG